MHFFLKALLIFICILLLGIVIFLSLKSGDLLIDHLADCLGFDINYVRRCGFASAFIFRNVNLKSPVLESLETPVVIKCDNVDIRFDYSKLLKKGAVLLSCRLENPVFLTKDKWREKK